MSRCLVAEAYGTWLARWPWQLFLTLTSAELTSPEAIFKRCRWNVSRINYELLGRHWQRRSVGLAWCSGVERHKSGNPHLHALLYLPGYDLSDRKIFSLAEWQSKLSEGGHAWLELIRSKEDTARYVAKYILKDGDIYLSPSLQEVATRDGTGQGDLIAHDDARQALRKTRLRGCAIPKPIDDATGAPGRDRGRAPAASIR